MKLSIITPYYNTLEYTKKLAESLEPQLTDEVEWIIVDNGCNEKKLDKFKAKVIHLKNGTAGPSKPRNIGIDNAKGKYIAFIDSDDIVYPDYIETILNKINTTAFDYCFISWKSPHVQVIIKDKPPYWNRCVWNCIYAKSLIGKNRFKEDLHYAEDWDFNKRIRRGKRENITKILYYYNDRPNSTCKYYESLMNKE